MRVCALIREAEHHRATALIDWLGEAWQARDSQGMQLLISAANAAPNEREERIAHAQRWCFFGVPWQQRVAYAVSLTHTLIRHSERAPRSGAAASHACARRPRAAAQ